MYKITVPLIQVATKNGAAVQIAKGGLVPSDVTDEALANLIELKYVEKDEVATKPDPAPEEFDPAVGGGAKETLAYVGDDKSKAAAVLEIEQAKGDKARKTLVADLEKILAG